MEDDISQENPNSISKIPTLLVDHSLQMQGEFLMKKEEDGGGKNSLMEVVQLEIDMEKKKIREEIIASQIIRRRELEAEVRMEIMMEEQSMGSSVDEFGKNVKLIGGIDDPLQIKNNVFGDEGEKQQIHDEVELGKRPFERDPSLVAAQVAGKYVAGVGGEEVLGQAMPSSGISGRKRKAETSVVVSDEETASGALQKKKWYCSLCGVSATSAGGLNLHLHGKKHKAKEAVTKSGDTGSNTSNTSADSYSVENSMHPMEQAVSDVHVNKVQPMEEEKSQVQPMDEKKSLVTKKWECSLCQLSVTSEALLKSHLQGKKHKAKEAVTISGNTASNISTDSYSVENSMQPMEQLVGQVQPMEQMVSQVQTTEEEKSQVLPVDEETSQVQPMEEEKSKVQLTEEKKSLVAKKWECSLCQLSVTSETLLKSHLQGKKHKAKEAKLGVGQGMSGNCGEPAKEKNVDAKKWYCSLCQVSAASEKNLNDHFQGKKHKAKAGLADQEAGNMDSDSIDISKDEGEEGLMNEQEKTNTRTEPRKIQVSEQGIVDSLNTVKTGLEGDEAETEELEKSDYNSQEMDGKPVKLWHCKMCNEGTYDEATMANHRKSSKHMNMLREIGGCLIVVSNMHKEADEGEKGSQDAALE
ncbi:uncharacterized protein [Spinacia oleracea]|uniref:Uncharacterized protein isoform X2 n=1 Tax=Spinacia oleracea TaxID=3562 RepID=A0A9R0JHH8_SPIOL|nr:uncharacterized protein LOC110775033 isoform X2 [Spinacia oleracea]